MTTSATATDWRTRARDLAIRGEAWIDGRYVPAASGATFDCLSPIDGRLIARVAATDAADVDRAVAAALLPGDPLDPETRLGAIVDQTQLSTVLGYIDSGRRRGRVCASAATARARTPAGTTSSPPCSTRCGPT